MRKSPRAEYGYIGQVCVTGEQAEREKKFAKAEKVVKKWTLMESIAPQKQKLLLCTEWV